jgi:hypothetical protein
MTPGACRSDFNREAEGIGAIIQVLMENIIARTTEAGSRTLVHGVSVGEETHGKYMKDCVIGRYELNIARILRQGGCTNFFSLDRVLLFEGRMEWLCRTRFGANS